MSQFLTTSSLLLGNLLLNPSLQEFLSGGLQLWDRILRSYMELVRSLDFRVGVARIRSESENPMLQFPLQLRFNPSKVTWRCTLHVCLVREYRVSLTRRYRVCGANGNAIHSRVKVNEELGDMGSRALAPDRGEGLTHVNMVLLT